jgi:hypothetical protein
VWTDGHLRGILGESEGAYISGMSFIHGSSPSVFSGIVLIIPGGQLQVGRALGRAWVKESNLGMRVPAKPGSGMLSSGK